MPVVIEATSLGTFERNGGVTREVCGSWSDNDYVSCDEHERELRATIAEAMRESPSLATATGITPGGMAAGQQRCNHWLCYRCTCTFAGDAEPDGPMEDARSDFSDSPPVNDGLQFPVMDT